MKTIKMSLASIGTLSRSEMKTIMAGSYSGERYGGDEYGAYSIYCGYIVWYGNSKITGYGKCDLGGLSKCEAGFKDTLWGNHPGATNVMGIGCWSVG